MHGEGTHTGQFIAFPPSGKHAVWRSVGFFRVEDGLIREHWGIPDLLGLLIQIGVIPPPDAESARGTVEAQAMSAEANRALIQRFYDEGWNANDLDVYDELVTEDFARPPGVPGLPPGREGFKALNAMFRSAFPDVWVDVDEIVADDDKRGLPLDVDRYARGRPLRHPADRATRSR